MYVPSPLSAPNESEAETAVHTASAAAKAVNFLLAEFKIVPLLRAYLSSGRYAE